MAKGRPPELTLDPELPGPAVQAVTVLDDRGRLQLPPRVLGGWLTKSDATFALAVLNRQGRIRLYPWSPFGETVVARRRDLVQRASTDDEALEALRALEDRYKRIQIPMDARPTLTAEMIVHLDIASTTSAQLYIWRMREMLEIVSQTYRVGQLSEHQNELDGLPD